MFVICSKCKKVLPSSKFGKGRNKNGLHCWCKSCRKIYHKEHKNEKALYDKEYNLKNKNRIKKERNQWYLKNRKRILKERKEWRKIRKEELKKQKRNYYLKNKEKIKQYRVDNRDKSNAYSKNRRRKDPWFKFRQNLSGRIWKALKGINKSKTTMILIGCDAEYLKNYLESKFSEGMTWENYGKWHIDHIRPCASFDLSKSTEQRKCFHYTNLQPLWALDNMMKGSKT